MNWNSSIRTGFDMAIKKVAAKKLQRRPKATAAAPVSALRSRNAPTATSSVAANLQPVSRTQTKAAIKKFESGVLARNEAAPAGKPLPPGATHEIVGRRRDGSPILKRKRFSVG
jgi:hypothetical protein